MVEHIARYRKDGAIHYGVVRGESLLRMTGSIFDGRAAGVVEDKLSEAQLLCPLESPRIFAVGMNYRSHIAEAGAVAPEFPQVFMKPSTAAIGPQEAIVLPKEAGLVHHECELAIVIGRQGRRIPPERAKDHIFGYTCANDVSERVIQAAEMKLGALLVGKGFDTFCPLGPVIATGIDGDALSITTRVNGVLRQKGHTRDLLFSTAAIVSYISQAVTLLPGDVILTGTPSGVGPLESGDQCEIEIENIGTLVNQVISEDQHLNAIPI